VVRQLRAGPPSPGGGEMRRSEIIPWGHEEPLTGQRQTQPRQEPKGTGFNERRKESAKRATRPGEGGSTASTGAERAAGGELGESHHGGAGKNKTERERRTGPGRRQRGPGSGR